METTTMVSFFIFLCVSCILSYYYVQYVPSLPRPYVLFLSCLITGQSATMLQLFLKSVGELLKNWILDGQFDFMIFVFLPGLAVFGFMTIYCFNVGLSKFDTVIFAPVYNACLITCSTIYGMVYYQEYENIK
eukprot:UN25961